MEEKQAVSVSYNENIGLPEIVSKAKNLEAEELIKMAEEVGTYIHKDPVLLSYLDNLKVGNTIPKELYAIMAEILAYTYVLQGKTPEQWKRKDGTMGINKKV